LRGSQEPTLFRYSSLAFLSNTRQGFEGPQGINTLA
jgi:hypothetical protein